MPVSSPDECARYHTFELPDGRIIRAAWDMRDCVDDCLGRFDFTGKTVLEVGPANGFYTIAMEKRGPVSRAWKEAPIKCGNTSRAWT
jgi:O-methyltransferase